MRWLKGRSGRRVAAVAGLGALIAAGMAGCGGRSDGLFGFSAGVEGGAATGGNGGSSGSGGTSGTSGTGGSSGDGSAGCGPGATLCNGTCTVTAFDPQNCGKCANACGATEVCSQGSCGIVCSGGTTQCDTLCVNTQSDVENCGKCGNVCGGGELCSLGQCGLTCVGGTTQCGNTCVKLDNDPANCGTCAHACATDELCSAGQCGSTCVGGTTQCGNTCVDTQLDPQNCGKCGNACGVGEVCSAGKCGLACVGGTTQCGNLCVDTNVDPANCGGCGKTCTADQVCSAGKCASICGGSLTKCGNTCVDLQADAANCGKCGNACKGTQTCVGGACKECDSSTTDCDGDGWTVAQGDCCDKPGVCGADPALVNPGAIEVIGNGIDDNCNGLVDLFDKQDAQPCDDALASDSSTATDYAKSMGICRTTTENPANPKDRTWGLITSEILRADGSALGDLRARSIRQNFGAIGTTEGKSFAVISTGIASDATQTNPGPNGGAPGSDNVNTTHNPASNVSISTCTDARCIKDWFATANAPLKQANQLPAAPGCGGGPGGQPNRARDSVMLHLRLRAPTNARAFSFNSYFISAEYPEYVCNIYNDQFIALVDTPSGTPSPIPNPVDKNLMTYTQNGQKWPIGINIANGTSLFSVCEPQASAGNCWDNSVNAASCSAGFTDLIGTGFEKSPTTNPPNCLIGGGTYWLTTAGNVVPGAIVELRIVIWDVGDTQYDSDALIDGFKWLPNATLPGTSG